MFLVGNILTLENQAAVPVNDLGGSSLQTFEYDSLYRLTKATGSFTGNLQGLQSSTYTLDMAYDTIHNIERKSQNYKVNGQVEQATSFEWTYHYQGPKPHAATKIGQRDYAYDADGN